MIKTILLADDSITMQKVIRLTFASGGYELITADNGDEAIKKAEEARPHIVLVDAALPGKDGYEVCDAIKNNSRLKDTPVIILAGTFNPLDDNKAVRVKADDSIVKPFESKHLVEKVEHLFKKFPPLEREAGAPDSTAVNAWEEDDIIEAPGTSSAPSGAVTLNAEAPVDETIERAGAIADLETFEGQGAPISTGSEEAEDVTSKQSTAADEHMPDMKTPDGESEGERGFDIEGFEINPFKSEPLREEPIFEEPDAGPADWSVDEEDVAGFDDLEPEREIEAEEEPAEIEEEPAPVEEPEEDVVAAEEESSDEEPSAPTEAEGGNAGAEEEISEEEPTYERAGAEEDVIVAEEEEPVVEEGAGAIESEEEPCEEAVAEEEMSEEVPTYERAGAEEDVIVAEEEPAEEETGTEEAQEEEEQASPEEILDDSSKERIRELVRKASIDVIEEVVREMVPGLIRKAVEDEMERIKETLKGL